MRRPIVVMVCLILGCLLAGCAGVQARKASLLPAANLPHQLELQKAPVWYDRKNLDRLLGGEAEFFLSYGFRFLETGEYSWSESPRDVIRAGVFNMGNHLNAFGIFSSSINDRGSFYKIGAEGFFHENSLVFYKGKYFVRVYSQSPSEVSAEKVKNLASLIDTRIKGDTKPPSMLALLPDSDLIANTKRYVAEGVLGYPPLKNGITGRYIIGGREATAFVCSYWHWPFALDALSRLLKDLQPDSFEDQDLRKKIYVKDLGTSGFFVFCSRGKYIFGIKGAKSEKEGMQFLRILADRL